MVGGIKSFRKGDVTYQNNEEEGWRKQVLESMEKEYQRIWHRREKNFVAIDSLFHLGEYSKLPEI
jgi:hypothetical protein